MVRKQMRHSDEQSGFHANTADLRIVTASRIMNIVSSRSNRADSAAVPSGGARLAPLQRGVPPGLPPSMISRSLKIARTNWKLHPPGVLSSSDSANQ